MSDLRIARSALTSTFLFLSMSLAHNFGGAVPKLSAWSVILWVATFAILSKVRVSSFSDPALAALVLLFQTLGHIVISADTAPSDLRMCASHLIVGSVTFTAIRFGCQALDVIARGLSRILPILFNQISVASQAAELAVATIQVDSALEFLRKANQLRAPPSLATLKTNTKPNI